MIRKYYVYRMEGWIDAVTFIGQEMGDLSPQVQINNFFQRTMVNIFLPIIFNICFGCSKEPSF